MHMSQTGTSTKQQKDDPDGNTWLVQEVTTRLPDRI